MTTHQSIVEWIAFHAQQQPDRLCLADGAKAASYQQVWRNIYGLSRHLKTIGVSTGDCVLVECTQNVDYMICEFAIQLAGGIFVPVEKNSAADRIHSMVQGVDGKLYIGKKAINEEVPFLPIQSVSDYQYDGSIDLDNVTFPNESDTAEILFSTGTTGKSKGIELSHGNDVALAENVM